jgi:hypothetical protein
VPAYAYWSAASCGCYTAPLWPLSDPTPCVRRECNPFAVQRLLGDTTLDIMVSITVREGGAGNGGWLPHRASALLHNTPRMTGRAVAALASMRHISDLVSIAELARILVGAAALAIVAWIIGTTSPKRLQRTPTTVRLGAFLKHGRQIHAVFTRLL